MAGILGQIFGPQQHNPLPLSARIQSSVQGQAIVAGAGQNRIAGNLIWYGDFAAHPQSSQSQAGGKGGAGGSGKGSPSSYTYTASFIVSLGNTIAAVNTILNGNQIDFLTPPSAQVLADLAELGISYTTGNTFGATLLLGDYAQSPWSYLVSAHPDQALNYRGEALACFANIGLGSSPTLPNFNFELTWALNGNDNSNGVAALGPDVFPSAWIGQVLSNPDWGSGFPAALVGDLGDYKTWCGATGMVISPLLSGQSSAATHLQDIMGGTVADFVWSGGQLKVVPYATTSYSGNGYTYAPDFTPVYDLTEDDFQPDPTGQTISPVHIERKDARTVYNKVRLEYLDRSNLYNPVVIYDQDDAGIADAGRIRQADVKSYHFFCLASAAQQSLMLQLGREAVKATATFTLPATFILLDPMDLVTLTVPGLGLDRWPVRIKTIVENADRTLSVTAEEFLGTAGAPLYPRQRSLGAGRNNNVDPGLVNTPLFFEPTDELAGGLYVYAAISGQNLSLWGGCNIWASYDAAGTFTQIGTLHGAARMGVTTADLPTIAAALNGQTIDNTNTLSVDLSESAGTLNSGLLSDMTGLNTASYVGGEIIAYQNATLTGPNAYNLAPMVRGAYGSGIGDHPAGTPFARLDEQIFKLAFTQDRIGSTVYLKFQSFNIFGGGLQDLSTVSAFSYVIKGSALASPLPSVSNIRPKFVDGVSYIDFDEITDFRPVMYEVRRGVSWETGNPLGTIAHPPFPVHGDDTYWIAAKSQPVSGLTVYSETPESIAIAGSIIVQNAIPTYDEAGGGWAGGTITGPGAISGANFVTTASGTIAYWQPASGHNYDVGFTREVLFNIIAKAVGVPVSADFLGNPDMLNTPDLLSSLSSQFIDFWLELQVGVLTSDIFSGADVFAPTDVFQGSVQYGPWIKYTPGKQLGEFFNWRFALISYDENTQAAATAFKTAGSVDERVDHYLAQTITIGTPVTINFQPDGWGEAVAFQGGPNGATVPYVAPPNIRNAVQGDTFQLTALSLSSMTFVVVNSGSSGSRTIDITVTGW